MAEIDWSKAPEWATHAMTTGPVWDGTPDLKGKVRFVRKEGVKYVHNEGESEACLLVGVRSWVVAEKRPAAQWSGTGLPPVGTVCEVLNKTLHDPEWERCTILFSGKHRILYDSESCSERVAYFEDVQFRPIRTEALLAEEERKAFISEIAALLGWDEKFDGTQRDAGKLFEAGYRKQEPKP